MATLFMLDGFGWDNAMPLTKIVQKWKTDHPSGQLVQVPYNNDVSDVDNINRGADLLSTYLTNPAYTSPKRVITISMGGSVAAMLLRRWGTGVGPVAPENLDFVLLANPERKYNGGSIVGANFGGVPFLIRYADAPGVPADTLYHVIDFARQYDGVADWPDLPNPTTRTLTNSFYGLFWVHNNYLSVTLEDANNVLWTEENIDYVLSPTALLPLVELSYYTESERQHYDELWRPEVEDFYTRHGEVAVPTFDPPPVQYFPPEIPVYNAVDRRIYQEA